MTATALIRSGHDVVDLTTGEVVTPRLDMVAYLARLSGSEAIQEQKQLAAAYDAACAALIGANDVQIEGGRTFKKKSAWRKMGRYFGISTSVVSVYKETVSDVFVATVTVRASAPWGQFAETVGACGTDEATGRRVITMADAIATAETRATNRAISNLVAMGEVSAEEMNKGNPSRGQGIAGSVGNRSALAPVTPSTPSTSTASNTPGFRLFPMPFGKDFKGRALMDIPDDKLSTALDWAAEKGKFDEFQAAGEQEMEYRATQGPS